MSVLALLGMIAIAGWLIVAIFLHPDYHASF